MLITPPSVIVLVFSSYSLLLIRNFIHEHMSEQMSENTKYVRKWTFLQIIIFKNIAMKYEKGSIDYANFMTRYNLIIYFYLCLLMNFELTITRQCHTQKCFGAFWTAWAPKKLAQKSFCKIFHTHFLCKN